ncbi:unnamed protein product [Staurois parvus]|uniref:Uncharacterized protein n=1 Tax=Staurois parvus TaxID=386267 RepID=A0ABN9CHN4_9NEOB|nr:unnamed protein product [Staurois parvus]
MSATYTNEGDTTPSNDTNDEAQFLPVAQMIGSNDINDGSEVHPLTPNKGALFFPTVVGTFSTPTGHSLALIKSEEQ